MRNIKKRIIKTTIAVSAFSASLVALAGVASAGSITLTGPGSFNSISSTSSTTVVSSNHNQVHVSNNNHQTATSGHATVFFNTIGGSAMSGSASNWSHTWTSVHISNH